MNGQVADIESQEYVRGQLGQVVVSQLQVEDYHWLGAKCVHCLFNTNKLVCTYLIWCYLSNQRQCAELSPIIIVFKILRCCVVYLKVE